MRNVYIVGNDSLTTSMFLRRGWGVVSNIGDDVDLIQFTGGEDVDPSYYKEPRHPATRSNPNRDAYESTLFHAWNPRIPMAGICRGGQFLNVMCGGSMWQHVTGHTTPKGHEAECLYTGEVLHVTSTHHQMMIPGATASILMTAQVSGVKSSFDSTEDGSFSPDIEAVLYEEQRCLCFQPHPEYVSINTPLQDKYFEYLDLLLK